MDLVKALAWTSCGHKIQYVNVSNENKYCACIMKNYKKYHCLNQLDFHKQSSLVLMTTKYELYFSVHTNFNRTRHIVSQI